MRTMIKYLLKSAVVVALLAAAPATAQILPPGGALLTPPPPPAPPPPSMAIPVVPKLDEMPSPQNARPSRRSFGDRITDCLQDGAAAGLGPNDRAAYSRSCANR
ncbi:hypothetical protein [Tardiphaga sp.]|uniref:hypothetical protein n=1 Tax=Tardiphaga sp. TaxID=1926292 RepID=UPI00260C168A|nr:hypothetical protein [Tardiphaga sp.]